MQESPEITLYRIVRTNPPTGDDMRSHAALGRKPRGNDPEDLRLWRGISLFDSIERARAQARRRPWYGDAFIATLVIPRSVFQLEATRSRGHYTLWGHPHAILDYVQHVERV